MKTVLFLFFAFFFLSGCVLSSKQTPLSDTVSSPPPNKNTPPSKKNISQKPLVRNDISIKEIGARLEFIPVQEDDKNAKTKVDIFLRSIASPNTIDTITIGMRLPEGIFLKTVEPSFDLGTQIDYSQLSQPSAHIYALKEEKGISVQEGPIATLFLSETPSDLLLRATFFRNDGVLFSSNEIQLPIIPRSKKKE